MTGYTGGGLRTWKQGTGGKTYFLYDGAAPVCELDASGSITATNTFGGSGLLSRHTASSSTFYTFDERGNVVQRLNAAGTPTSTDSYDAYGASASSAPDPFGFGGQFGYYTDRETGLQLCQHRYYDSSVGRFLTRDPAGYGGGLNLYAYCANNPVTSADPSGFNPQNDGGDGGGNGGTSPDGLPRMWYDDLADNDQSVYGPLINGLHRMGFGSPLSNALLGAADPSNVVSGLNDLGHLPQNVGHLGEASATGGAWGVAKDLGTAATVVSLAVGGMRASGGISNCFVANTPVQMADGTTKPIQEVRVGDRVQSRNPKTGKDEVKRVVRLSKRMTASILTLSLADAKTDEVVQAITCTPGHPFYVQGRGFVLAGNLALGNSIVTRAGPALLVKKIKAHQAKGRYVVYNFEVQDDHTYFVGKANGGTWVHNASFIRAEITDENGNVIATGLSAKANIPALPPFLSDLVSQARSLGYGSANPGGCAEINAIVNSGLPPEQLSGLTMTSYYNEGRLVNQVRNPCGVCGYVLGPDGLGMNITLGRP